VLAGFHFFGCQIGEHVVLTLTKAQTAASALAVLLLGHPPF
jgi:hypothetical protein